jgi:hypothetical protein
MQVRWTMLALRAQTRQFAFLWVEASRVSICDDVTFPYQISPDTENYDSSGTLYIRFSCILFRVKIIVTNSVFDTLCGYYYSSPTRLHNILCTVSKYCSTANTSCAAPEYYSNTQGIICCKEVLFNYTSYARPKSTTQHVFHILC